MKRNLILLLTLSLLLNGFMPRYSLFPQEYDNLTSLIQNQPLLQYYYALSAIPVLIVSKIFNDHQTAAGQSSHRKNTPETANSSSEFSILLSHEALSHKRIFGRTIPSGSGGIELDTRIPAAFIFTVSQSIEAGPLSLGEIAFLMLILMLFILLPRSSLGDSNVLNNNQSRKDPICETPKWGFFIGGSK